MLNSIQNFTEWKRTKQGMSLFFKFFLEIYFVPCCLYLNDKFPSILKEDLAERKVFSIWKKKYFLFMKQSLKLNSNNLITIYNYLPQSLKSRGPWNLAICRDA